MRPALDARAATAFRNTRGLHPALPAWLRCSVPAQESRCSRGRLRGRRIAHELCPAFAAVQVPPAHHSGTRREKRTKLHVDAALARIVKKQRIPGHASPVHIPFVSTFQFSRAKRDFRTCLPHRKSRRRRIRLRHPTSSASRTDRARRAGRRCRRATPPSRPRRSRRHLHTARRSPHR